MIDYVNKFSLFLKFDLRLSDNTVKSYNKDLNKYIDFLLKVEKINSLKSIQYEHIRKYIAFLTKKNQKPSSINRNISSIKKFHLYLLDNEIIFHNPS